MIEQSIWNYKMRDERRATKGDKRNYVTEMKEESEGKKYCPF